MIVLKLKAFEDCNIKIEDGYISFKTSNPEEIKWSLGWFKNINSIIKNIEGINIDIQPDRSKREDSQGCEMRCSEHCGNTVREVQ